MLSGDAGLLQHGVPAMCRAANADYHDYAEGIPGICCIELTAQPRHAKSICCVVKSVVQPRPVIMCMVTSGTFNSH